jgi:hypothetical protein
MDIRAPVRVICAVELVCAGAFDIAGIYPAGGNVVPVQPHRVAGSVVDDSSIQHVMQPCLILPEHFHSPLVRLRWWVGNRHWEALCPK